MGQLAKLIGFDKENYDCWVLPELFEKKSSILPNLLFLEEN